VSCSKDIDQEDGSDQEMAQEQLATAHSDSEGDNPSEYGSALSNNNPNGLQYSSEGELYNMESVYRSDSSDQLSSECFGAIRELRNEYESDNCL
jgi:hypothetical protein